MVSLSCHIKHVTIQILCTFHVLTSQHSMPIPYACTVKYSIMHTYMLGLCHVACRICAGWLYDLKPSQPKPTHLLFVTSWYVHKIGSANLAQLSHTIVVIGSMYCMLTYIKQADQCWCCCRAGPCCQADVWLLPLKITCQADGQGHVACQQPQSQKCAQGAEAAWQGAWCRPACWM